MAKIREIWNWDVYNWDKEEMREEYFGVYGEYPKDEYTLTEFMDETNARYLEDEQGNIECHELNHPIKY